MIIFIITVCCLPFCKKKTCSLITFKQYYDNGCGVSGGTPQKKVNNKFEYYVDKKTINAFVKIKSLTKSWTKKRNNALLFHIID